MSCTVVLNDVGFRPVQSTAIIIDAYDPAKKIVIDTKSNTQMIGGNEWGATLGVGNKDIYDVIVDTTGTNYAPPILETFGGSGSPRLDLVLFSTLNASAAAGPSPQSSGALTSYIASQVRAQRWKPEDASAIFVTIGSLRYLRRYELDLVVSPSFSNRIDFSPLKKHCVSILLSAGIDPELVA